MHGKKFCVEYRGFNLSVTMTIFAEIFATEVTVIFVMRFNDFRTAAVADNFETAVFFLLESNRNSGKNSSMAGIRSFP